MRSRTFHITSIVILTLLITYLHYATLQEATHLVILEELYYLPLLVAVTRFGPIGALATFVLVSTVYIPFFFPPWTSTTPVLFDRILHLAFSAIFVIVAVILARRERLRRITAERERYLAGIGRVAAVIVHDLKNPLISIFGFARRIAEGKGDATEAAGYIMSSAARMQGIVEGVLDFSKPLPLEFVEIDLGETVQRAVDLCRTKAEERRVDLAWQHPAEPITARLDSAQVERALVNLIDNAVDASTTGGKVILNATASLDGMIITITDRGAGMSRETLDNLFVPFYSTKSGGSGLGMPIAKKIVEAHAGTLHINSREKFGTEVSIRLPHHRQQPATSLERG